MLFSVIIPVYNRPDEIDELLESLAVQETQNFEVLVVEDGSTLACKEVTDKYISRFPLTYFFKPNEGRSLARNYGLAKAKGDYLLIFDSDCILPPHYFTEVTAFLQNRPVDCFGGPDQAHTSFTPIQKAISYSMTSLFTTGGLRGNTKAITKFYPRSFNMGLSRKAYEATGGFPQIPLAEDIDLSMNLEKRGFALAFIPNAFVYHKRRTNFSHFYRQINRFGIGRIDIFKRHPGTLKLTHFFPTCFIGFVILSLLAALWSLWFLAPIVLYILLLFLDALIKNKDLNIAILSVGAAFVQLFAYGIGFAKAFLLRVILGKGAFGKY